LARVGLAVRDRAGLVAPEAPAARDRAVLEARVVPADTSRAAPGDLAGLEDTSRAGLEDTNRAAPGDTNRAAPEDLEDTVPADLGLASLDPGSLGLEVRDRAGLAALVGLADTNRADRGPRARDREVRDLGQNRARLHRMAVEPGRVRLEPMPAYLHRMAVEPARVGPERMPSHRHRIPAHLAGPTRPRAPIHLAGPTPLEEATRPEEATSPGKLVATASKHLLVPPLPAAYDA
jgi:hypothetical protein